MWPKNVKKYVSVSLLIMVAIMQTNPINARSLETEPTLLHRYNEIATQYISDLPELYNNLTPEERVFIYYLYRASLPGNRIAADQIHRSSSAISALFEYILTNADVLKKDVLALSYDVDQFLHDVETYAIYLWTNHGQYFLKEHANAKRTPERLGLATLTQKNLTDALVILGYPDAEKSVVELAFSLFDAQHEHTSCVANNIKASAINIYSPDFTEEDYHALPADERTGINSYFFVDEQDGARIPKIEKYKVGSRYGKELETASYWLQKAYEHAQQHTNHFDADLTASLDHLITFLHTGDEDHFKKHSIAWLKSKSRLDYCFGFIETYDDPKDCVGLFQAEVTIKTINMNRLNELLPSLEKQLPFPQEFMRETIEDLSAIPNASINKTVFSAGGLGPLRITAAYCLPNYSEIRSQHGSKQIIYQPDKTLNELIAPELVRDLCNTPEQAVWLAQHDPQGQLYSDLWSVHCILHETLGHGSGRLATHVFKEGELLTIGGKKYTVGDEIPVTSENIAEFLAGNSSALEELRAEIIALYTSIAMVDELDKVGLYKEWTAKIGKDALIEQLIFEMAATGLRRYLLQDPAQKEITGAHALANMTIMNYLCDGSGLELVQDEVDIDDATHQVLGFRMRDLKQVLSDIESLMIQVQTIKSTGDGVACDALINTYGRFVRNAEHVRIMQANQKTMVGDLKVSARIYPRFVPAYDKAGVMVDIDATWPASIVEQWQEFRRLELSCDV